MPMWLIYHEKTRSRTSALQQLSDCLQTTKRTGKFLSDDRFAVRRSR
jgi:hypothetical protein